MSIPTYGIDSSITTEGLAKYQDADEIHILSAYPASYAEVSTYSLGSTSVTVGAPSANGTQGFKVTVPSSNIEASASDFAVGYCIVNTTGTERLSVRALKKRVKLIKGKTYVLPEWRILIGRFV